MKLSEGLLDLATDNFITDNNLFVERNVVREAIRFGAELLAELKKAEFEEILDEMANSHLNELAIKEHEDAN